MISKTSHFKYIDRGKEDQIVLIPGWGSDYRIFDSLDLNFNYLIPLNFSFLDFEQRLFEAVKDKGMSKISLLGWSLGSFLAAEFSAKYPQIVDKLILVGIRRKYPAEQIDEIKSLLLRSKKGYLLRFYSQCFYDQEARLKLKNGLMKDYLEDFDLNFLLEGLDYLKAATIDFESLKVVKQIKIIQGKEDKIAPLAEVKDIKNDLPQAEFISIKEAGHAVFLEKDIAEYL